MGAGGRTSSPKNSVSLVRAISTSVAQYVTVKTFAQALRGLVVEEFTPQLLGEGRKLSDMPEGYVFSVPSRSHRFVFVDQAAEDIDPANAWRVG